ncbi:vitellogenin receptor Yl-like isoform X2 [Planococcus citri]|uniref:vitellogenin receptor Yl-like isoform X2 n=1 Tax=Planococcus citri TaxID=170843 RepID=UPI0031F72832
MIFPSSIVILILAITTAQCRRRNPKEAHFRCLNNEKYIRNDLFCNGEDDCGDNSDENVGCDESYHPGDFKCGGGNGPSYMKIKVRCNANPECLDGLDELNCGGETNLKNCTELNGKFACEDESKCIDFKYMCNGECNCLDCSDEKNGCYKYDEYLCQKCSHACISTSTNNISLISETALFVSDQNCAGCSNPQTRCEHKCIQYKPHSNQERCLCDENYKSETSETKSNHYGKCYNDVQYENILIYSTSNQIKVLNLTTNLTYVLQQSVNCTAISASQFNVYFATTSNKTGQIFKTSISSENKTVNQLLKLDSIVESLSADWLTSNIYFSALSSIFVCDEGGKICSRLLSRSAEVYSIILAPRFGWMFWIENNRIFKSTMDGVRISEIFKDSSPISLLQVDEPTNSIYWFNSYEKEIQFMKLFNFAYPDHKKINQKWSPNSYENIASFSIFENSVFFSIRDNGSIFVAKKVRRSSEIYITDLDSTIKNIFVYNPLLQRTKIPNPCNESFCFDLCLQKPASHSRGLNHSCIICENTTDWSNTSITEPFWCQMKIPPISAEVLLNEEQHFTAKHTHNKRSRD